MQQSWTGNINRNDNKDEKIPNTLLSSPIITEKIQENKLILTTHTPKINPPHLTRNDRILRTYSPRRLPQYEGNERIWIRREQKEMLEHNKRKQS